MLGTLALAGIGCALLSNPRRKSRRAKKRNPVKRRRAAKRRSKSRRRNPGRETFLSTRDDMKWLKDVHKIKAKSAVLYGNEDAPTKVEAYSMRSPTVSDIPVVYVQDDNGDLVRSSTNPRRRKTRRAKKRNPAKRRRVAKRKSNRISPDAAAARLAHWRWHRNPKPRDLTEHEFTRGKAHVTIATWRNANATAFVAVTARGPGGVKTWEAKSQGPGSGGYSKPQQALERVFYAMTKTAASGQWPSTQGSALLSEIAGIAAAKVGGTSTNPRRRKGRRNPRVAKTKKVYVIQGNYGYGWDDEAEEDTWKEAREQLKTYRANGGGSYRCITRREKLQTNPRRRSKRRAR